ncbi:hypothetical protein [Kordia sp.]|uniref:hypothetical protein n=1 Tax=Kordia sp. TaxID=1965332 RepID=UPI0025C5B641|nr:hypothetical protein [Kordia sp.]MCH2195563.1 hypothetical protein [Kordia sp.]
MLSFYLLASIIVLVVSLLISSSQNNGKKIALFSLSTLMVVSVWILARYIRSSDIEFYKNVETHAIEHLGYDFSNTHELNLMNDDKPATALFDEEQGKLTIKVDSVNTETPFQITYEDLGKPLLVSTNTAGTDYKIANTSLPVWNPQQKLEIPFSSNRKLACSYYANDQKEHFFIFEFDENIKDGVKVIDTIKRSKLNIGYPILDMVEECFDIELSDTEIEILEETYLVRNKIYSDPSKHEIAPLHLYPGKLAAKGNVTLGSQTLDPSVNTQKIVLKDNSYFYIGIGQNKSAKLQLNYQENRSLLKHKSPARYPLYFNDSIKTAELLISTSVDDIIKSSREYSGVINFEGRSAFDNRYHINASLKYAIEDGQTKLNAIKIDNNSGELKLEKVLENQPFVLKTNTKAVDYIVQVKNYNKNMLTCWYWLPFFILIVAALFFYFLIHKWRNNIGFSGKKEVAETKLLNTLKIEYALYWVITVFLTVRIYLLWRMYAFPPLEDITFFEFQELQNMESFKWTIITLIGFLIFRFVYLFIKIQEIPIPFAHKLEEIIHKINLKPLLFKLGILAGIWIAVFVFLLIADRFISFAFIITCILLPLFAFIYIDSKIPEDAEDTIWMMFGKRLLNLAFYILIYYKFDAGFCLIALAVGSFYFLIKNTYFLVKEKQKKRTKYSILTGFYLFVFFCVFFSHYIIPQLPLLKDASNGRIAARGKIIYTTPGEMLLDADFNSTQARRILWASESHWFANNHLYERVKNKAGYHFPNIRTQYNSRGVSLTVHTREFVVLRYLIFEHNIWLPILLIAHFLALLLIVGYYYYPKKHTDPIDYFKTLGAISLFLILSIIMYLVCINSVIFIGQDFPFLTLTGKAAIIIPFILIGYIMYHLNYKNIEHVQQKAPAQVRVPAFALLAVLFLIVGGKVWSTLSAMDDPNMITHEATQPVERLKGFVDIMNSDFRSIQKEYKRSKRLKALNYKHIPDILDRYLGDTEEARFKKIDTMVNNYVKQPRDASYLTSALKSFDMNEAKNLEHILHIRKKRYSDQFEFVVNSSYYRIKPIFESSKENPDWGGDLLAMETPNQYYLQPVQQKKLDSIFKRGQLINRRTKDYESIPLDRKLFGNSFAKSKMIKLYRVPSKWLFTDDDAIVAKISNEKKVKRVTLSNRTRIYKEENTSSFSDFILNNGDIFKIEDYRPLRVSYNSENYLALNYNYNGKQRFFYPLGKGMIWAYNYSKLLEKNYEKTPPKEAKRATFDYLLQQDLNDLAINKEIHDDFFLTVMDGEGHVRAMFDYNRGKENYKINPNDHRKLNQIYEEIYFNTRQEDLTLGTRNIRKIYASGGFGSTIKPIVYGAITSQQKLDWDAIKLNNMYSDKIYSAPKDTTLKGEQVKYFGNKPLVAPWLEATGEFKGEIDNKTYILKSKNAYNGMMMLLGSYSNKRLKNYRKDILRPDSDTIEMRERFPRFTINGRNYVLSEDFYDKLPQDLNSTDYVLRSGLINNFDFDTSRSKMNTSVDSSFVVFNSENKINTFLKTEELFGKAIRNSNFNYQWVFPEKQAFIKNSTNIPGEDLRNNIINPAKGGSPFELTQLGMLENIVRLFKLNSDIKATVQEQTDSTYTKMNFAVNDWSDASYKGFVKKNIYQTMHNVPKKGTAQEVFKGKNTFTAYNTKTEEDVTFYVYAKTGTHNGKPNEVNDKSLVIVISDVDLTLPNYETEPKLYTMLLTINSVKNSEYKKKQKKLFDLIIKSESFKLYYEL